jgi:hypothetical protein
VLAVGPGRVLKPVYCVAVFDDTVAGTSGYFCIPIHTFGASWQFTQPVVTPVWICEVEGMLPNCEPGTEAVEPAAIGVVGATWQFWQELPDGMCDDAPIGEDGGITMIFEMPVKLVATTDGPWQPEQVVEPVWLIFEFANEAPSCTVAATLEPEPTWQTSQDSVVGICTTETPAAVAAIEVILKPAAGIANEAAWVLPWHCTQLVVWLGACRWMFVTDGDTEKSGFVWQSVQIAAVAYGMWFAGLVVPAK